MRRKSLARASDRSAGLTARSHATASSGNVFRELGCSREEAAHLLVRADLLIQVQKAVASRPLPSGFFARVNLHDNAYPQLSEDYAATTLIRPTFRERGFRRITISIP